MLTKKVKMYGGYIDTLGTIHDCKCIAEIDSYYKKGRAISDPAFL